MSEPNLCDIKTKVVDLWQNVGIIYKMDWQPAAQLIAYHAMLALATDIVFGFIGFPKTQNDVTIVKVVSGW